MPSLRQLEFAFRGADIFSAASSKVSPGKLTYAPAASMPAPHTADTAALLKTARELLCSLGANRIARELRVEWNPRLKTAAGRADYREKLISLNPRLIEYPGEIDRTLRHELAHLLAQFHARRRRIPAHGAGWRKACVDLGIPGEKRCHTLPFPAKRFPPRFTYRCPNCHRVFSRVRRIKQAVACLECCKSSNGGQFDARFRLELLRS